MPGERGFPNVFRAAAPHVVQLLHIATPLLHIGKDIVMARRSPADKLAQLLRVANAWQRLRPRRTFGGLTVAQFRQAIQPSLDARAEIADLQRRLLTAIAARDDAD